MESQIVKGTAEIDGKTLILESGKLAGQADGAVVARMGDTMVLATACMSPEENESADFLPLTVDYEERLYAAGKISGSRFIKREGRPTEEATLTARLVDRSIRPLFPKDFRRDVQVIITVLSFDGENDPDVLSIVAASAALMQSSAPFSGPIAACRIGEIDGELVVNPTRGQMAESSLDLVVAGTSEKVVMLEAGAKEISEDKILEAVKLAQEKMTPWLEFQEKFRNPNRLQIEAAESEIEKTLKEHLGARVKELVGIISEDEREEAWDKVRQEIQAEFEGKFKQNELSATFDRMLQKEIRHIILDEGKRPDGRSDIEIRPIASEVGLLPRTHGSALFSRGETQALTIATLGSPGEEQFLDTMEMEGTKRFMHHYNFPPYSTGECKRVGSASRREIGHGALAERALLPVVPSREEFPYTIRLVTEILSSNGSTSMAATCGCTLALMDAGIPIKKPVAGIAMGLVTRKFEIRNSKFETNSKSQIPNSKQDPGRHSDPAAAGEGFPLEYKILTDIQGLEDFGGDMDFKVAGTDSGITAIQMDTKIDGLTLAIVAETLERAKTARLEILEKIKAVIPAPRAELSPLAPRITTVQISPEKIGDLIGPGGKTINKIIAAAGGKELVNVDIEEDGTVLVSSSDAQAAKTAVEMIEGVIAEPEIGRIYPGVVKMIKKDRYDKEIGAIVQFLPGKDGMVHISEVAPHRVESVSKELKVGQEVPVKVLEIDAERGRVALSIKQAQAADERGQERG